MNEFKNYHPVVNFTYFLFSIIFTCVFMHPVMLTISVLNGLVFYALLKGVKSAVKMFVFIISAIFVSALVNAAFNHAGATILAYLPSGNPLTAESILFGICAGAMIAASVILFSCFNEVMTSDKFIYLFGRIAPSLSLILSMTLRFVPLFINRFKAAASSGKCIGRDMSRGGVLRRMRCAAAVLSSVVTQCLEGAVDTADSMLSRGYGLEGRGAFSIYIFSKRDKAVFAAAAVLAVYVIAGGGTGAVRFSYFPFAEGAQRSFYMFTVFAAHFLLSALPIIIETAEVLKWKSINSKM